MSDDGRIMDKIETLVDREHQLRARRQQGGLDEATERRELQALEVELDQCWDLLRQRRAKRDFGRDPEEATSRSAVVVEGYWQ